MNNDNRNSEKFLTIYKKLDQYMRECLNEDKEGRGPSHSDLIHKMTRNNRIFKVNEYELKKFEDLKNAIIRSPDKRIIDPKLEPIAEPQNDIVRKYQKMLDALQNPPVALKTIAIDAKNIYYTSMDSIAIDVIKEMNKNTFTHVPVVEDGKMIGIFSENTIISYIASNEDLIIENDALIKEFAEFIPINSHESECFEFVSRNSLIIDIEEKFQNGLKDNKRVAVVFITETGKENEKLLGLVTAWDLAGYDKYND